MSRSFKQIVNQLPKNNDDQPAYQLLSSKDKEKIFEDAKQYIVLQEIIESLKKGFLPEEEIVDYLPFSNEGNSAFMTGGFMGMHAPINISSKEYIKAFPSFSGPRSDRLMIFTTERIIFLFIVEYLDNQAHHSYPYANFTSIMLRKKRANFFSFDTAAPVTKDTDEYYWFDFQTTDLKIFTEMLSKSEGQKVERLLSQIEKVKDIPITNKPIRKNRIDRFFSNYANHNLLILYYGFWGLMILFFIFCLINLLTS